MRLNFSVCGCSVFGAANLPDGRIVVFGGEVDPSSQGHAGAGEYSDATLVLDTKVIMAYSSSQALIKA